MGCRTGGADPGASSEVLPTGLVGPVAPTVGPEALRYVALGDSYAFGDGVRQRDRWPNQLVHVLRPELDLDLIANLAARSVASRDVIDEQLPGLAALDPQFVTIQVGANDACLFKADTPVVFAENMGQVLDALVALVGADRVVVLTIPDFTLAPNPPATCAGDRDEQAERIGALNAIIVQAAATRGITVVDVAPIADRVAQDPGLVTADGTYPSAKQYAGWADLAALAIRRLFRAPARSAAGTPGPSGSTGLAPAPSASSGPSSTAGSTSASSLSSAPASEPPPVTSRS